MFSILDFLRSDGSIVINKKLAKTIGLNEAIIYSELVSLHKYWENRGELTEDGWFFCTIENLEDNTTLKKDTQNRVINRLEKKLGLIETKRMGLPAKRYFRITDKIFEMVTDNKDSQNAKSDNTNVSETQNADEARPNQFSQNAKTTVRNLRNLQFANCEGNNTNLNNTDLRKNEEEDIYISRAHEENIAYEVLGDFLESKFIDQETIQETKQELAKNDIHLFTLHDVETQFDHMMMKQSNGQRIYDFAKYFARGLKALMVHNESMRRNQKNKDVTRKDVQPIEPVPFYNWLEN